MFHHVIALGKSDSLKLMWVVLKYYKWRFYAITVIYVCNIQLLHTKVCNELVKARSPDYFRGTRLAVGHVISNKYL